MRTANIVQYLALATGIFSVAQAGLLQHLTLNVDKQNYLEVLDEIPGDSPISLCDSEEHQLLSIDFIEVDPNPPTRGSNLTISAAGNLEKDIVQGAYVIVDVRYGYIRLLKQTIDLCEEVENVDLTCPIEAGYQELTKQIALPNEIPPGKYFVEARAYTIEDELITCLKAAVEFPVEI
jgi:hypothetical protein